jgi:hypothetical protein
VVQEVSKRRKSRVTGGPDQRPAEILKLFVVKRKVLLVKLHIMEVEPIQ